MAHWLILFTGAERQGRDIFNEKPAEEELLAADGGAPEQALPAAATIHTSVGDIMVKLHHEQCPKTVENFSTHAKNGYYDTVLFHRVIKNFMLQTGAALDPTLINLAACGHYPILELCIFMGICPYIRTRSVQAIRLVMGLVVRASGEVSLKMNSIPA